MKAPRLLPHRPLPAYAFRPGHHPHPTRDPRGHSHGRPACASHPDLPPERWAENESYLWGIDLYNEGFHWEAHEVWECVWNQAWDPVQATFLQGLIQCSVAALKGQMGQPEGRVRLGARGLGRLWRVRLVMGSPYMGVPLEPFLLDFARFAHGERGQWPVIVPKTPPAPG